MLLLVTFSEGPRSNSGWVILVNGFNKKTASIMSFLYQKIVDNYNTVWELRGELYFTKYN